MAEALDSWDVVAIFGGRPQALVFWFIGPQRALGSI